MQRRALILPLTTLAGLLAMAVSPPAIATCATSIVLKPHRTFTLTHYEAQIPEGTTTAPTSSGSTPTIPGTAEEAGWLTEFDQTAELLFDQSTLMAHESGPLVMAVRAGTAP